MTTQLSESLVLPTSSLTLFLHNIVTTSNNTIHSQPSKLHQRAGMCRSRCFGLETSHLGSELCVSVPSGLSPKGLGVFSGLGPFRLVEMFCAGARRA